MPRRVLRFTLLLLASWCAMTMLHELGHILCGCACGGTLQEADVMPWNLPQSHFQPDPMPLVTAWGGPLLGVFIPLIFAVILRRDWIWFIAFFCMIANGAYIALSWLTGEQYLDTARLLRHGASPASIAVYCVLTIGIGYAGFRRACIRELSLHVADRIPA